MTAPKRRGAGKENPVAKTLAELFTVFDKDGSGQVKISELHAELSHVPGVVLSAAETERLRRQFEMMGVKRDGKITYQEFEKAVLASFSSNFSSLQKQKEAESLGYDVFTLLALSRRCQLAKSTATRKFESPYAELEALKEMSRMTFFTLDMMEEERKKKAVMDGILRDTTIDFHDPNNKGLALERAAALARARSQQAVSGNQERPQQQQEQQGNAELEQEMEALCRSQRRKHKRRLIRDLQRLAPVLPPATDPLPLSSPPRLLDPISSPARDAACGAMPPISSPNGTRTRPHDKTAAPPRRHVPGLVLAPLPERSPTRAMGPDSPASPSPSCCLNSLGSPSDQAFDWAPHAPPPLHPANSRSTSMAGSLASPLKASRLLLPVLLPQSSAGMTASDPIRIRERRMHKLRTAGADLLMQGSH